MSPVTHFFTGWVLANCAELNRKDRALVTLACVVADIDGLGIIPEILTRHSTHPLLWFSLYHHSLHNLAFASVVTVVAFAIATRKWTTGLLVLLSFHLHCSKTCSVPAVRTVSSGQSPTWRRFPRSYS